MKSGQIQKVKIYGWIQPQLNCITIIIVTYFMITSQKDVDCDPAHLPRFIFYILLKLMCETYSINSDLIKQSLIAYTTLTRYGMFANNHISFEGELGVFRLSFY